MASTTPLESLVAWLKDARAAEKAAIDILGNQDERIESYPDLHQKVREHLQVSRRQAERLEEQIQRLGGSSSTIKEGTAKFLGNIAALTNASAHDEAVKSVISNYAYEHFEIASYRSLVATAEAAGEEETRRVCEEILREEEAMAAWLEGYLPEVTRDYLQRLGSAQPAKR